MYVPTQMKQDNLRYLVCFLLGTLTNGCMEHFEGGRCNFGHSDIILYDTIYMDCVDHCRARVGCSSISVDGVRKLCRIHVNTAGAPAPQIRRGYVFSDKRSWSRKDVPGCEKACSNNTTCMLDTNGRATCVYRDCPTPPSIEHGTTYGNTNRVGSRSFYRCDTRFRIVYGDVPVRTCESNGNWGEGPPPTCVQYEFYLPEQRGHPDYQLVGLFANGISLLDQTWLQFRLRKANDAHVLLTPRRRYTRYDVVEIALGSYDDKTSVLRHGIAGQVMDIYQEYGIVTEREFRDFWIGLRSPLCIQVGKGAIRGADVILEWCGFPERVKYVFIGAGYESEADFVFP